MATVWQHLFNELLIPLSRLRRCRSIRAVRGLIEAKIPFEFSSGRERVALFCVFSQNREIFWSSLALAVPFGHFFLPPDPFTPAHLDQRSLTRVRTPAYLLHGSSFLLSSFPCRFQGGSSPDRFHSRRHRLVPSRTVRFRSNFPYQQRASRFVIDDSHLNFP